jgi:uncharacterized protein YicC (UPF0701 family)
VKHVTGENLRNGVVLTPDDIERELVEIVEQLERGTVMLSEKVRQLEQVSTEYDVQYAKALWRSSERSADKRKAQALLTVEELFRERQLLETQVRLIRDTQHDLRAELEAVRSIGASVRAAAFMGGGDGSSQSGARRDY